MPKVQDGQYRDIFTTPETFYKKVNKMPKVSFMKMAKEGKLSVVEVDEAHLITSWQSFR